MKRNRVIISLLFGFVLTGSAEAQLPVSDSDFVRVYPPVTQVTVDTTNARFNVAVMIDNATPLGAISLPLTYAGVPGLSIDTTVRPSSGIIGVTFGPAGRSPSWTIKTTLINDGSKNILIGFISFFVGLPPTDDTLCYVHFDVVPGSQGTVLLDTTEANSQIMGLVTEDAFEFSPTWTPGLIQVDVGIGVPGDMDCDLEVTVGDIIYLVNYIFKNGPEPCSLEAADTDCDGQLAVSDAIYLVNYLFRGGPEPSPPCL